MPIRLDTLTGDAIGPAIDGLSALRISVFRDFPYLYDGSLAYEANYLGAFAAIQGAAVIAAFDADRLVGAATCAPLAGEDQAFRQPFEAADMDVSQICYFGESVLEPEYRGRGIGHRFFDGREDHARALGLTEAAFCAVIRAPDDPRRPPDYRPLDRFWEKRGYRKADGLICRFSWKDIGESEQSEKPMQFWMRAL